MTTKPLDYNENSDLLQSKSTEDLLSTGMIVASDDDLLVFEKRARWRFLNVLLRTAILAVTTAAWMGLAVSTDGSIQVAALMCAVIWSAVSAVLGHYIRVNTQS